MRRCWGAEAGIFPISDSRGLILSREGEEEGVASQISSSAAAPTEGGGSEGQTDGRSSGSGAEREVVWKQGKRQPSQTGLTDTQLVLLGSWGRVG